MFYDRLILGHKNDPTLNVTAVNPSVPPQVTFTRYGHLFDTEGGDLTD